MRLTKQDHLDPAKLDRAVGDMKLDSHAGPQLATYVRYNVLLERDWLKSELGIELAPDKIEQIRKMDDPSNLSDFVDLGRSRRSEASQAGASACRLRPARGAGIRTERSTSLCWTRARSRPARSRCSAAT